MNEALKSLEQEYIDFICKECNITEDELFALSEDDLYDKVYDVMCDIEIAETPSSDEPLTDRCKLAEHIVTELGNTISDDDEVDTDNAVDIDSDNS